MNTSDAMKESVPPKGTIVLEAQTLEGGTA